MKHFGKIALMIFAAGLCAGCASICSKSNYDTSITSSPDEAEYLVTDESGSVYNSGKTPATMRLRSGHGYFTKAKYIIEVKKTGYHSQKINLVATINSAYFGNIIFEPILGFLVVDPSTGAMWELQNLPHFNLVRDNTVPLKANAGENQQTSQDNTSKTNDNTATLKVNANESPQISRDIIDKKDIENNLKKDSGSKGEEYFF